MTVNRLTERSRGTGLGDLVRLLRDHRNLVLASLLLVLAGAGLGLLQPLLAGRVIDAVRDGVPLQGLVTALVALFAAQVVLDTGGRYLLERTGESVVLRVRRQLVARMLRFPIATYQRHRLGDLISRAASDAAALREVAARGLVELVVGAVTAVAATVLMLSLDLLLFVVLVVVFGVAAAGVAAVLGGIRSAGEAEQAAVGEMTADLERALSAIRTIRIARAEHRENERIDASTEGAYRAGLRAARLSAAATPAVQCAATGSFLLILVVGGARVASGDIELGTLITVLLYATYLVVPLGNVLEAVTVLQRARGALARVEETLALPVEQAGAVERSGAALRPLGPPRPDPAVLRFEDVSFSYGGPAVLRGVSFALQPGTRTAVVGPSGAGKSTILALICRFHEPTRGTIHFQGRPGAELDLAQCRAMVALVEQDAPALYGTMRDNLAYAAPGAPEPLLHDAVRRVHLDELLGRLPDGWDTAVGEHGASLSGGERQRLAVARALLARPALLLLDEPTASLDGTNENAVLQALDELPAECAVLVVAHRLSTVQTAEEILVLSDGAIEARGTHHELLRRSATYRQMVAEQLGPADAAMDDAADTGTTVDGAVR